MPTPPRPPGSLVARRTFHRAVAAHIALTIAATVVCTSATPPSSPRRPPAAQRLPGAALFDHPSVTRVQLHLPPPQADALRRDPRTAVPATATLDGTVFTNVAVQLKGAAGSFRPFDDRPALTLSFSRFVPGRRWHGLRKIHLNNSVQDETYLNEYLGSELFRAADVPTPRVAHATLQLNDRDLGLYVLKEGWTEDFLKCHFAKTKGNLYEGGFVQDIDTELELEEGEGVKDQSDLRAVAQAARESDPARRWVQLQQVLDVDRFARYLVISIFVADWDGYALNRNNYRIYFNPESQKAVMMPHGMDQLFQRLEMELDPWPSSLLGSAFIDCPEGRQLYYHYARELFTNVFTLDRMTNAIHRVANTLRPVQPDIDERAGHLQHRVQIRHRRLARDEFFQPPPPPMAPIDPVPGWAPQADGEAQLESPQGVDGHPVLRLATPSPSTGSWRTTVHLRRGAYRLHARARTHQVEPLDDERGRGAGIRLSGNFTRDNLLVGTTDWTLLHHDFQVSEPERDVVLVAELRAKRGWAEFDPRAFRLEPLPR